MSTALMCLAFVQALDQSPVHVPEQVDQLVRSRVAHQLRARIPGLAAELSPTTTCEHQGRYHYTADSLVLQADTPWFMGRAEYLLSDVIEGRALTFPLGPGALAPSPPADAETPRRRWVPWVLGAVGAGAVGFLVYKFTRTAGPAPMPLTPTEKGRTRRLP